MINCTVVTRSYFLGTGTLLYALLVKLIPRRVKYVTTLNTDSYDITLHVRNLPLPWNEPQISSTRNLPTVRSLLLLSLVGLRISAATHSVKACRSGLSGIPECYVVGSVALPPPRTLECSMRCYPTWCPTTAIPTPVPMPTAGRASMPWNGLGRYVLRVCVDAISPQYVLLLWRAPHFVHIHSSYL